MSKDARLWAAPAVVVAAFALVMLLGLVRPSLHTTMFTIGLYALIALPLGLIYGQGGTSRWRRDRSPPWARTRRRS